MSSQTEQGIKLRIFVGCQVDSEVRMHLNFSDLWKREQVIRTEEGEALEKISHEKKEYVGITESEALLTMERLEELEEWVRRALLRYCPELEINKFKMSVIPQLFLS